MKNNPPTINDFLSYKRLGRPYRGNPARIREWDAISVFDNVAVATKFIQEGGSRHGVFLARIIVPDDIDLRVEQTGANRNHYSIFDDAETVFSLWDGEAVFVDANIRRQGRSDDAL